MFKKLILSLTILLIGASVASAQQICALNGQPFSPKGVQSVEILKDMATLQDGRVKPFDTYAKTFLLQLSGRKSFEKEDASTWFARFLLAPQSTNEDKVFLINNPDIADALGIEPEKKRRYSFAQLDPVVDRLHQLAVSADQIDPKERDIVETELIRVYENLKLYSTLSLSFSFAFPHPDFTIANEQTIETLGLPKGITQFSFINIALKAEELQQMTEVLRFKPMEEWSEQETEVVQIVASLFQWTATYNNLPFTNIPSYTPDKNLWVSPWDGISSGMNTTDGRREISLLSDIVVTYWNGQQLDFDLAAKAFKESVNTRALKKGIHEIERLELEVLFNKLKLLFWAKILFLLAFILSLAAVAFRNKTLNRLIVAIASVGFLMNLAAITIRIIILHRPPVSNLYETFIFVALIAVLTGLIIEWIQKNGTGNIIAALSGFTFLTIAEKFGMDGDTLQVLIAVLNTNFWLGTHVITITIGYAGVCVAGIVGHIYILQGVFGADKKQLEKTQYILIGTLGFGLATVFLGTTLGGIWADQSWGRFWGWDPKENGALLIVLWCALLFHAKLGRMIGPLGLAAGSAFGIVVVMWAWFGVNLLSVGLHSYGFTTGLANNLMIYFILQMLFLVIFTPIAKMKLKKSKLQ